MNKKVKFMMVASLLASITICSGINTVSVSADTTVKSQQGAVIRSASISTTKTIKVPDRSAQKAEERSRTAGRPSRGTTGSNGASTTAYAGKGNVVSYASRFLGVPYVWGASSPKAFDCSGFTAYVYSAFGVSLPHYTGSQVQMGQAVAKNNLAAGDLVFFNTSGPISHVGIYIGGGQFIHASSGSGKVTISNLSDNYYATRYAAARRILQ